MSAVHLETLVQTPFFSSAFICVHLRLENLPALKAATTALQR